MLFPEYHRSWKLKITASSGVTANNLLPGSRWTACQVIGVSENYKENLDIPAPPHLSAM